MKTILTFLKEEYEMFTESEDKIGPSKFRLSKLDKHSEIKAYAFLTQITDALEKL